ncbi:MAG: hypothetical protein EBX52_10565 [Proteobacteria bacterium]|nr:hypothetical protein [Pseudomonadota bacterium]
MGGPLIMRSSTAWIAFAILAVHLLSVPARAQVRSDLYPSNMPDAESAEAFMQASYYQNGHGLIFAMPKIFELARWLFPSTFRTNGEDVMPFNLFNSTLMQTVNARDKIREEYGLITLPLAKGRGKPDGVRIVGMLESRFNNRQVFIAGCASCHSGKAAGRYYAGLGNKTIDPFVMSRDSMKILNAWGSIGVGTSAQDAYRDSLTFSKLSSNPDISNLSQGLVPTSMIKAWAYRELGKPFPYPGVARGVVKPPHLWGIPAKRKAGFSANGEGRADSGWLNGLGWMMGAEMAVSGPGGSHIRESEEKLIENYLLIQKIQPPRYPYPIDSSRAKSGKKLFAETCIRCHQAHERDPGGEPLYLPPKRIQLAKIGTDPARSLSINDDYRALVKQTSWQELVPLQDAEAGYLAPQLWGIWARFPYLHNGSVPTVYDLLLPPESRPVVFSLKNAGEEERFDPTRLGLTRAPVEKDPAARNVRDTRLPEQSNAGHFFGFMSKYTEEDRLDLIEYLKTL